jgi:hypothetical protein
VFSNTPEVVRRVTNSLKHKAEFFDFLIKHNPGFLEALDRDINYMSTHFEDLKKGDIFEHLMDNYGIFNRFYTRGRIQTGILSYDGLTFHFSFYALMNTLTSEELVPFICKCT